MGGAERTSSTRGHESYGIKYGQHAAARDILGHHLVVERKKRIRAGVVEWRCGRYRCLLAQSPRRRVWYAFWRAAFGHGAALVVKSDHFSAGKPLLLLSRCKRDRSQENARKR